MKQEVGEPSRVRKRGSGSTCRHTTSSGIWCSWGACIHIYGLVSLMC